ncbi:MAG: 4-hydroxybenzoyl-CoA thioesterase [Firmicutes bacterium]|nr:4-hydroxybenzoyl-CoA thioesterase [Bacillota bacterium]
MITVREKVRFVETDLMGVVHHSNYFRWFEMGRVEHLRQAGVLLTDLLADGIVVPITHVDCQYRASAKFDDYILIETTLEEVSPVKMIFTYKVIKEVDGVLLATGSTQNLFTDNNGKIIRLSRKYYDKLQMSRDTKK